MVQMEGMRQMPPIARPHCRKVKICISFSTPDGIKHKTITGGFSRD
jgi:hypothetical protein